jgi:pimeloyl-ACP methyl ester carboxylesterase
VSGGLTSRVRAWESAGTYVDIDGRRIFTRSVDGDGPLLVLLHGYPSSSYDWRQVLPRLDGRRVLAFDFLGFGLSAKPPLPRYSLLAQADLVTELVAGRDVVLVAHDMGTSVANELMARDLEQRLPFALRGVFLFNGSMVVEKAHLTPAQRALRSRLGPLVARLSNPLLFRVEFRRIFSSRHPLERAEADDQWSLLAHDGGHRIIDRLTNYLHERVEYAPRWHGALRDWAGPLELGWAGRDPVCVEDVLQAVLDLRPAAPLTRWPELGHYPQVEDPDIVAAAIAGFADRRSTTGRSD